MKLIKLTSLSLVILLIQITAFAFTGIGTVGTATTNPGASAVMVTKTLPASGSTNASPSANYVVSINTYCSVAATYQYQVLNASQAVVTTIVLPCQAGVRGVYSGPDTVSFAIPDGFTLRVINTNAFTGTGQAEIYYAIEGLNN